MEYSKKPIAMLTFHSYFDLIKGKYNLELPVNFTP